MLQKSRSILGKGTGKSSNRKNEQEEVKGHNESAVLNVGFFQTPSYHHTHTHTHTHTYTHTPSEEDDLRWARGRRRERERERNWNAQLELNYST